MLSQNFLPVTGDSNGNTASMAVGQGQQHCNQLYLPGAKCFRKYSPAIWKILQDFQGKVWLSMWPSWRALGTAVVYPQLQEEVGTH